MDDLSDNERLVLAWATDLHEVVWSALCRAMEDATAAPPVDLPAEFIPLEWLLDGDRWPTVKKAIAISRRPAQIAKHKKRKRVQLAAFRERRRVYMRTYRANLKNKETGKQLDD